jgi:D-beta-D-heptose 7-phosphate kinase/D-beta-D-heptose 1-phosphate adenosyltransferase
VSSQPKGSISTGRIDELLQGMRDRRVLVVGDLMLDRYVSGTVERVSPEAPVPVVKVESERHAVGGAGNVAANVTALGARCVLVGCVGDDADGDHLRDTLSADHGIDTSGVVRTAGRRTTVKTRVLAQRQQIVRVDREVDSEVDGGVAAALADKVRAAARSCDAIVVQDYDKGVLAPAVVDAVRDAAAARNAPWVVDPKRRSFFAYAGATVFKPNARELGDALGARVEPDDPRWMESTRVRLECEHLLLTLGERGMSLQSKGSSLKRLPAVARDVYDVSGAGDTVTAVVALSLAARGTACEAAALANHAAAVEVSKSGVQTVSPDEIRAHTQQRLGENP